MYLKWLPVVLLFVLSFFVVNGQHNHLDSLKSHLNEVDGSLKFDLLYDIAFEHMALNQYELSVKYLDEAKIVAQEINDSLKIVKAGRVRAQMLRRLEKLDESVTQFLSVLSTARNNGFVDEHKYILNGLGLVYTLQSDYDKALHYHFEALVIREREGDEKEIYETLNNIGLVYFKLKDFENALSYYFRSLNYAKKVNSNFQPNLLINIGLCYNQIKNYHEAEKFINEGLRICAPSCNELILIDGEFGLGLSHFGLQEYQKAKSHFNRSYNLSRNSANKRFQIENLVLLAKIMTELNLPDSASIYLAEAEMLASNSSYKQLLIDVYQVSYNLFNKTKDHERASFYQNKYILLKDSVYSESLITNLAKVQTQFHERENIKTIADKEEVIRQQQKITFAIIIIAILATLLIIVLFRSNKTKKRVNAALSEAKAIIEDQNKQLLNSNIHLNRELEERNVDLEKANESLQRVNEELDNFIYKTSHDIRGPLASLKGMCNVALIDVQDPIALSYLHKLDITADKLNTILTRLLIVNQINHSAIASDRIDFHEILNDVLLIEKKKGLPPNLSIRRNVQDDIDFYSDQEFIRLILSNLIGNAIKFYNDKDGAEPFVIISIAAFDAHIHLRVIDNGIGIKKVDRNKIFQIFSRGSERSETGGIGLYITKTAVEKLGGSIRLQTTIEGYTEFYIQLPMVTEQVPAE